MIETPRIGRATRWTIYCALLSGAALLQVLRARALLSAAPRAQAAAMLAFLACAFAALLLAVARGRRRAVAGALLASLVFGLAVDLRLRHVERRYTTDGIAFVHHAALLLLEGKNPYRESMWPAAQQRFGMPLHLYTKRADGRPETSVSYPAGAFCLVAPFVRAGLTDLRYLHAALLLLAVGLLALPLRDDDRLAPFLLLTAYPLPAEFVPGSSIDPLWLAPAVAAWLLCLRRPLVAALLFGLALSAKQQAWVVFPFFCLALARLHGRTAWTALGLAVAAFAAVNGWFLFDDPRAWWDGAMTPLLHPLAADGIGLVRLDKARLIGPLARWHYLALAGVAYALLLGAYWRWFARLAPLGPVLGLLPLALSTRSHAASFYLLPLLLLAGTNLGSDTGRDA